MQHVRNISKEERDRIFSLFLNREELRFSEIEKELSIRSNLVSYHLERMVKDGLLEKNIFHYRLTRKAERYIPMFSHMKGESLSAVPVMLVALVKDGRILLMKRNKRPYKGLWSLIGGKLLLEESLPEAAERLAREKAGAECAVGSVDAVAHERVTDGEGYKHSFILMLAKAEVSSVRRLESMHGELAWFDIKDVPEDQTIPSDHWIIKNLGKKRTELKNIVLKEHEGKLKMAKIPGD